MQKIFPKNFLSLPRSPKNLKKYEMISLSYDVNDQIDHAYLKSKSV